MGNKLHTAFLGLQRVKDYTTVIWNDTTPPALSKTRYDDIRAQILQAVLTKLPKQADNKARMQLAQNITQAVMKTVGEELTR